MDDYQKQFEVFYEAYFARMVRFSSVYVDDRQDAENLVQDIFMYLWEHPEVWVEIKHVDAFLFTLLRNRCLNFLKRQSHLQRMDDEQELICRLNLKALESFEETCNSMEDVESIVNAAIAKLPARCREILLLSKIEKLKYKEIAERMNISINTVENQMSIALKKLRAELKDYLPLFFFYTSLWARWMN